MDLKIIILNDNEIEYLMENKPSCWNSNKDYYHNIIFILNDYIVEDILNDLKPIDEDIDRIKVVNNTIFWISIYKDARVYSKTLYKNLSKGEAYPYVSLRNGNTFNKIYKKMQSIKKCR